MATYYYQVLNRCNIVFVRFATCLRHIKAILLIIKMLHISIVHTKIDYKSAITPTSLYKKSSIAVHLQLHLTFPPFVLFLFIFSLTHSVFSQLCVCHIALFWKQIQQRTSRQTLSQTKKNVIWLLKKLGRYERASFCVTSALFIYLKGCTLYQFTLPHSLRHRLEGSEVERINYFFIIIYKVIYL